MKYYCIACVAGAFIVLCYLLFHPARVGSYVRLEGDNLASNAGIYKKQRYPGYTKDVIVMVANYGVLDFIVNWVCSYDTSNVKFVVVSLDEKLHDHIQKYTKITSIDGSRFNASAGSNTSNFMTGEFNTISHMTVKCIHGILSEGYNIFFTDVDVTPCLTLSPILTTVATNMRLCGPHTIPFAMQQTKRIMIATAVSCPHLLIFDLMLVRTYFDISV
jgi:Nucleotide-diphospho-sugar transferase